MRLVTFTGGGMDTFRSGIVLVEESMVYILDISQTCQDLPGDMRSLLRTLDGDYSVLASLASSAPRESRIPLSEVTFGPVIANPEKILCIGLNYRDHAAEAGLPLPDSPTVFAKYSNTLIGSGECIRLPGSTSQVDYEAELAFVVGRRAKNVPVEEALTYVAGYTAMNDVTARDFQMRTSQWTLGKCFDTFAPLGPYLVTNEEIQDPHALSIRLSIGDEILQDSSTANLVFQVPELVAQLSSVMTLEPGDVVSTGTPAGVGYTRKPPRFLRSGEIVRVEIAGLGVLENCVRSIDDDGEKFQPRKYVADSR